MSNEIKLSLYEAYFTWDDEKEKANLRKHGVTFRLAAEVFFDENAVRIYDELHSDDEERYQLIGTTKGPFRVLFVVYVERTLENDREIYRIISARDANKKEMETYGMGLSGGISAHQRGGTRNSNVRR